MKFFVLALSVSLFSASSYAAPTPYEIGEGLVTIANANNEMDGPFKFKVCASDAPSFGNSDSSEDKNVSEYLVLRNGGDSEDKEEAFQVSYSVITSYGYVVESIVRLNSRFVKSFSCPKGTYVVYSK